MIRQFINKAILPLAVATLPVVFSQEPAKAIILNPSPGDFAINVGGIGSNAGNPAGGIDSTATPNGFGNFFSSNYVLLGGTNANASITASSTFNSSTATLNLGTLSTQEVAAGIVVGFSWVFQGNAPAGDGDNFVVTLQDSNSNIATIKFRSTAQVGNGYGSEVNFLSAPITAFDDSSPLTAGDYSLVLAISETFAGGNSAAGFNSFQIYDTVSIPFEFSPNLGLLILGGMWGGSYMWKRSKAKKVNQEK